MCFVGQQKARFHCAWLQFSASQISLCCGFSWCNRLRGNYAETFVPTVNHVDVVWRFLFIKRVNWETPPTPDTQPPTVEKITSRSYSCVNVRTTKAGGGKLSEVVQKPETLAPWICGRKPVVEKIFFTTKHLGNDITETKCIVLTFATLLTFLFNEKPDTKSMQTKKTRSLLRCCDACERTRFIALSDCNISSWRHNRSASASDQTITNIRSLHRTEHTACQSQQWGDQWRLGVELHFTTAVQQALKELFSFQERPSVPRNCVGGPEEGTWSSIELLQARLQYEGVFKRDRCSWVAWVEFLFQVWNHFCTLNTFIEWYWLIGIVLLLIHCLH